VRVNATSMEGSFLALRGWTLLKSTDRLQL